MKSHFISFLRNLRRHTTFSILNIAGLTVSFTSALLLYLYISHELSFDRFHSHAERIYRVNQTFIWGEGDNRQFASTGPGVATALRAELPEAELITSIHTPGNFFLSYTNPSGKVITFEEEKVLAVDSNFFSMFHFPLIKGTTPSALHQANTMVMTESAAKKYFGDEDPIGKLMKVGSTENPMTFEVTGITQDPPENSYIQYEVLFSMTSFPAVERLHWSWVWTQLETYIRLKENTNLENTKITLVSIPKKYAEETLQRIMNVSYDEYIKSGKKWELFLQPLLSIHLPDEMVYNRINESGNKKIVYSLIGCALFILLLSCINFMNLSTAQFTKRIKEASVRKILGVGRQELSMNYLMEAFLFCSIACILALGLTQVFLPGFNLISGTSVELNLLTDFKIGSALIALIFIMALIGSCYPTYFLTKFHPVEGLKGKLKAGSQGKVFRNGLVVFQFSISILLMACTVIVFQQLTFISEKDLGFDKENLLVISHAEHVRNPEVLVKDIQTISGVTRASWSSSVPPAIYGGDKFSAEGMNHETFGLNFTSSDEQFIDTYHVTVKYGRGFSKEMTGDVERVILNEAAIRKIGWAMDESSIGKKIESPDGEIKFEVIGIMKDFHYWSLETKIEPMALFHIHSKNLFGAGARQFITVRISQPTGEGWENTIAQINERWKAHAGDSPFQYSFIDQNFAATFKTQSQFGKVLSVMAGLAIFIASLGLLGMVIYSLEQRTKEIGIRKVSGASAQDILFLISKSFIILVIIAFLISAPVAYFLMEKWLQDFAYHVSPSVWTFIIVGALTIFIALVMTTYHATKASRLNPVDVLKDE